MSFFDNELHEAAHREAVERVLAARRHQVVGKGWTPEHDDDVHGPNREAGPGGLAVAASLSLLPSYVDEGLVRSVGPRGLRKTTLFGLLGDWAFNVRKPEGNDPLERVPYLDQRMANVTVGVALGLAELERLIRRKRLFADALATSADAAPNTDRATDSA